MCSAVRRRVAVSTFTDPFLIPLASNADFGTELFQITSNQAQPAALYKLHANATHLPSQKTLPREAKTRSYRKRNYIGALGHTQSRTGRGASMILVQSQVFDPERHAFHSWVSGLGRVVIP